MYLNDLQKPIDFERSRSKVKVTRGQKVKNIDRPYLKNYWADSLQTKTLVKGFPPICLVLEFHFRSKSSPGVNGQIHIFGFLSDAPFWRYLRFCVFAGSDQIYIFDHNSKTIGRIDLKQRPLDSSRRAAQKCCPYFSSYDGPSLRYSRFCGFFLF